jgi:uncharacterized alkaline shock family protein YloU
MTADRHDTFVVDAEGSSGHLTISEDVLVEIAHAEAMAVDGVVPPLEHMMQGMLRRRQPYHVRLEVGDYDVMIHMTIGVDGGVCIPEVANQVRQRIAKAVHDKTGYLVRAVNLRVDHMNFEPDAAASD